MRTTSFSNYATRTSHMNTTFADTILNISVTGNLIRLDLGTVVPIDTLDGKRELQTTTTQQVVMPLLGFLNAFKMQESTIKKLIESGSLKSDKTVTEPRDMA